MRSSIADLIILEIDLLGEGLGAFAEAELRSNGFERVLHLRGRDPISEEHKEVQPAVLLLLQGTSGKPARPNRSTSRRGLSAYSSTSIDPQRHLLSPRIGMATSGWFPSRCRCQRSSVTGVWTVRAVFLICWPFQRAWLLVRLAMGNMRAITAGEERQKARRVANDLAVLVMTI